MKNYHTPKFEFSTTPRSSISTKIRLYGYGAKSRWGLPRVHLGSKNWVTTLKNYHTPKFEFSTTPRSSISTKIRLYGYGAKSRCRPPKVHFVAKWGPIGSNEGVKTVKNYHALKIRLCNYPAVIDFDQNSIMPRGHRFRPKFDFTVMAPNHSGDSLGSILGVQKMGQHRKKLPYPQIRIFTYPAVFSFDQNSTLRLWYQITVGTP